MNNDMNWPEVTALIAGFGAMAAIFMFCTRALIREEILKLNDMYLIKEVADSRFKAIDDKFSQIEDHFDQIEDHFDYIKNTNHLK